MCSTKRATTTPFHTIQAYQLLLYVVAPVVCPVRHRYCRCYVDCSSTHLHLYYSALREISGKFCMVILPPEKRDHIVVKAADGRIT